MSNNNRYALQGRKYKQHVSTKQDWVGFEIYKRELNSLNLTNEEFEQKVKRYCDKHKL